MDTGHKSRYASLMASLEVKRLRMSEKRVASMVQQEDDRNDESTSKSSGEECTSPRLTLGNIWQDDHVLKFVNDKGEKFWRCLWCRQHFSQWNSTKAIHHLNQRKGCDIKVRFEIKMRAVFGLVFPVLTASLPWSFTKALFRI